MIRSLILMLCIAGATLGSASAPRAQSRDTARQEWYKEISVNGLISGSYTYNFNQPGDRLNTLRVFDIDHNSLGFDLAQLVIQHDAARGEAGFRVDMNAGPHIPALTHANGMSSGDFDFRQAYISYVAPVGNGLRFDLGKFVTLPGYEVVDSYDGYNENASRSFLFGYAIPYTHTGLKASYSFTNSFAITAMVANGWDNVVDNNLAKTLGLQVKLTPIDAWTVTLTGITGCERTRDDSDRRTVIDLNSSAKLGESITLGLSADYGMESFAPSPLELFLKLPVTAIWKGIAGYLRLQTSDKLAVTARAETFNDNNGSRTGAAQTLVEFTLTPELRMTPHLILRSDIRFDHSSLPVFVKAAGTAHTQTTVSANAILTF